MKRKTRVIKPKEIKVKEIDDTINLPFHLMFPVHLSFTESKEKKDCYFKDEVDMKKYVKRYNLKPKNYTVTDTLPR